MRYGASIEVSQVLSAQRNPHFFPLLRRAVKAGILIEDDRVGLLDAGFFLPPDVGGALIGIGVEVPEELPGGEIADPMVFQYLFYNRLPCTGFGWDDPVLPGEIGACDLEAVQEQSSAFEIEVVFGDSGKDDAYGDLYGVAVLGQWQDESTLGANGLVGGGRRARSAGGVVVVTAVFAAQGGTAAAVALGEDVTALVAFGGDGLAGFHGVGPLPGFLAKVLE